MSKWKLVPVEATREMLAATRVCMDGGEFAEISEDVWRVMLEAAPHSDYIAELEGQIKALKTEIQYDNDLIQELLERW